MQSFKKTGIKLYEELGSQGTHCLYIFGHKVEKKSEKINARIISKAYAHLQTMEKMCKV